MLKARKKAGLIVMHQMEKAAISLVVGLVEKNARSILLVDPHPVLAGPEASGDGPVSRVDRRGAARADHPRFAEHADLVVFFPDA